MSRLEWVLGFILVILLLAAAGLGLSLWLKPTGPQTAAGPQAVMAAYADDVAPTPAAPGQTAKSAFVAADPIAKAWQPDAMLLTASATWPQGAQPQDIAQGAGDWALMFHSPSARRSAVITLTDGQHVLSPGQSEQTINVLASSSWQMDSVDVVEKFLNDGGKAFIEKEGITILTMTLMMNDPNDNGRIEWLISLLSTQTGNSYSMRIDAASGETLQVIGSP
jgi:hypothetical protein